MDHPFGKRLANTAALQEPGHHRTGRPVATLAGHRPDKRIAVRREGESAIDPVPHTGRLQYRIALEPHGQLILDPVDILLQQLDAVIPGGPVHHPVLMVDLIDSKQHALLVLPHIGKALQIDDKRQFTIQLGNLGYRLGQQVMVRQRRYRQFDPGHAANLFRPQTGGVHHMFA